ncbi:FG-GAP repeat domain-containing protein [Streptomyces sp. NPDC087901]|uniref:FG-GAP repeat domain-containing protein n=1 Tax=Streptomyces sp. NPDC087901 TaxID=3365818 RepID=UPI00380E9272
MSALAFGGSLLGGGVPAQAASGGEVVVPAAVRNWPRNAGSVSPGTSGYLSWPEGSDHYLWTSYATGETQDAAAFITAADMVFFAQSDTVAVRQSSTTPFDIRFRAYPSGADRGTVTIPKGYSWAGTAGEAAVAYTPGASGERVVHLFKPVAGGGSENVTVTGFPQNSQWNANGPRDADSLMMRYRVPTDDPKKFLYQWGLVDARSGTFSEILSPLSAPWGRKAVMSDKYVGEWSSGTGAQLLLRADLGAPPVIVPPEVTKGMTEFGLVGDNIVAGYADTEGLYTFPLSGGTKRQLLPRTSGFVYAAPDGSMLAVGGSGPQDWDSWRLSATGAGGVISDKLQHLPSLAAPVDGIALSGGNLTYLDQTSDDPGYDVRFNTRTVSSAAVPVVGQALPGEGYNKMCVVNEVCARSFGAGDGSVVYDKGYGSELVRRTAAGQSQTLTYPEPGGDLTSAAGRYAVFSGPQRHQYVIDWNQSKVVLTRTAAAATVGDGRLWTTTSTAGVLSVTTLGSDAASVSVNTRSGCLPNELQAVGRWVYWSCATANKAGVFDRSKGISIAVPVGDALLADGYLVRHDTGRGKLVRTVITSGKAVSNDLASLPLAQNLAPAANGSERRSLWNLDPHGRHVVFADAEQQIHLVDAGVPAQPVRRDHTGDGVGDVLTLNTKGEFTFQHGTGTGVLSGKTYSGGWSTSSVAVPFGDLDGDRCNDVLVRMPDGSLRGYRPGCGAAPTPASSYTKLGTGFQAYKTLTSPGDLTGDGRADLLGWKTSTGDIYLFASTGNGTLSAGKKIRTHWTYTKVMGVGDLNGDGYGDLLAKDSSNELWRYNGTAGGQFKERVLVFKDWGSSYNTIVGPGDLTGDGRADLIERDSAGRLYRNNGDGKGSFGSRTQISTGWQGYRGIF